MVVGTLCANPWEDPSNCIGLHQSCAERMGGLHSNDLLQCPMKRRLTGFAAWAVGGLQEIITIAPKMIEPMQVAETLRIE